MLNNEQLEFAYLPSGELNASFILSNANLLLDAGELDAASSLFRLLKTHPTLSHCAHFGIGCCFLSAGKPLAAVSAFEYAMTIARKSYIATALVDALIQCGETTIAEQKALIFADEFAQNPESVQKLRDFFETCTAQTQS